MITIVTILVLCLYIYLSHREPAIAITTCIFAAAAIMSAGEMTNNDLVTISGPILLFTTGMLVAFFQPRDRVVIWASVVARCILLGELIIGSFAFIIFIRGGFIFLIIPWLMFIAAVIGYVVCARDIMAIDIISTVGSCMRQNIPLAAGLESAATGYDKRSRILLNISQWLATGNKLSDSIKFGYPQCPGHITAMIAMAERVDQVPLAIRSIEADLFEKVRKNQAIKPIHPMYPIILISTTLSFVMGIVAFVIPKYRTIFEDLGGELPQSTQILIDLSRSGFLYAATIFIFTCLPLLMTQHIYLKFRRRRPEKPYGLSRLGDIIKWHLPIVHWFEFNYSMSQTVSLLRVSLNAGATVNSAIENSIGLDVNFKFKGRLDKWLTLIEGGEPVAQAARQAALGEPIAWAFDQNLNRDNTPQILQSLENYYRTNYNYLINLLRYFSGPVIIILLSIMVGCAVYAIFSPLVALINQMTISAMP